MRITGLDHPCLAKMATLSHPNQECPIGQPASTMAAGLPEFLAEVEISVRARSLAHSKMPRADFPQAGNAGRITLAEPTMSIITRGPLAGIALLEVRRRRRVMRRLPLPWSDRDIRTGRSLRIERAPALPPYQRLPLQAVTAVHHRDRRTLPPMPVLAFTPAPRAREVASSPRAGNSDGLLRVARIS